MLGSQNEKAMGRLEKLSGMVGDGEGREVALFILAEELGDRHPEPRVVRLAAIGVPGCYPYQPYYPDAPDMPAELRAFLQKFYKADAARLRKLQKETQP